MTAANRTAFDKNVDKQARELLSKGAFKDALKLFSILCARNSDSHRYHLTAAALLHSAGQADAGHKLLRDYYCLHPVSKMRCDIGQDGACSVLITRGFSGTKPTIGKSRNGTYKPKLRGGHFTLKYLMDRNSVSHCRLSVVGDNAIDPNAVPPHDLIINTIAEPDVEGSSLQSLSKFLSATQSPVINHPDRVLDTARDRNFQRFQGLSGTVFPKTVRLRHDDADINGLLRQLANADLKFPMILRTAGEQTGRNVKLVRSQEDARAYARKAKPGDHFAIAFHKILWQNRYFRKLRLFHIDGEL